MSFKKAAAALGICAESEGCNDTVGDISRLVKGDPVRYVLRRSGGIVQKARQLAAVEKVLIVFAVGIYINDIVGYGDRLIINHTYSVSVGASRA